MNDDDPVAVLERWCDSGAEYRVAELTGSEAVVELRSCVGELVETLRSSDPRLLEYLRAQGSR